MRTIPNYERYAVTRDGRVWSYKSGRFLKPYNKGNGYKMVQLSNEHGSKHFLVHRLVGFAYIPNPDNHPYMNHKDCNPSNNRVENLEWCTPTYNAHYSINLGRHVVLKNRKLDAAARKDIRRRLEAGEWGNIIAKDYNISAMSISNFKRGATYGSFPE